MWADLPLGGISNFHITSGAPKKGFREGNKKEETGGEDFTCLVAAGTNDRFMCVQMGNTMDCVVFFFFYRARAQHYFLLESLPRARAPLGIFSLRAAWLRVGKRVKGQHRDYTHVLRVLLYKQYRRN